MWVSLVLCLQYLLGCLFEISLAVGVVWREYRRSGLSFECRYANDDAYQSSE